MLSGKVGVGDDAPPSRNRTVADSADWHQVSTMDTRVDLYRWEIANLLGEGRPFLVVFGTPQHCTMCVDQIVRVQIMQEKHGDRFAFIHVDGYKDNPVWVEWGVTGEPWTFMVDARGKVRKVFPGQTEIGLLEDEMERLLKGRGLSHVRRESGPMAGDVPVAVLRGRTVPGEPVHLRQDAPDRAVGTLFRVSRRRPDSLRGDDRACMAEAAERRVRRGVDAAATAHRERRLSTTTAMDRFLRVGLPLVLVLVFAVIALFVLNAFEATDLMEMERRAGPTLLNR